MGLKKQYGVFIRGLQLLPPLASFRNRYEEAQWAKSGRTTPPPHNVKIATIRRYASTTGARYFLETGTYFGQTLSAARSIFDTVISIELDDDLFRRAQRKFGDDPNVILLHGDSAIRIADALPLIKGPCVFWLDAHFSGGITARGEQETPVVKELGQVLEVVDDRSVILIDDAFKFIGSDGYPTIEAVRDLVSSERPSWTTSVRDGIIRVHAPAVSAAPSDTLI